MKIEEIKFDFEYGIQKCFNSVPGENYDNNDSIQWNFKTKDEAVDEIIEREKKFNTDYVYYKLWVRPIGLQFLGNYAFVNTNKSPINL
jgi:hypothetical protein